MKLAIICDGSYIYCVKSLNNYIQRLLFPDHKKDHFFVRANNGYIVHVFELYPSKNNDSLIQEDILNKVYVI